MKRQEKRKESTIMEEGEKGKKRRWDKKGREKNWRCKEIMESERNKKKQEEKNQEEEKKGKEERKKIKGERKKRWN